MKKNKVPTELIFSLPNDLLVNILARVSRLDYPILSLVSKRFSSVLTLPELYQTRSLVGLTENCLYVCLLSSRADRIPSWFKLCRRPILASDTRKSSGYVLATIPIPHSPPLHRSSLVAVGSNIYNIGGSISQSQSSSVSILDCWSHTWLEGPSMQVEREYPSASLLDGKIYVTGGCRLTFHGCGDQTDNVVVDGKLHSCGGYKGVAYNPNDGRWDSLGSEMNLGLKWSSSCVIENVIYYYYHNENIKWYDTKVRSWRTLNGLKTLPRFARYANVRLADYGGKMALFWDKFTGCGNQNRMIWCAIIALERRNNEEIWGNVEWSDAVLPHQVPMDYVFEYVVAVNV
ncbi:unnamed protein product [Arabidopsis thaliana]|uniref:F-box domain-containing protein n=1 Tax=Arabidopsis thaliana TaxID=3702 RepID=A0A5S9V8C2_ARATH|nr:unnamed protein product [Arabidopsis thaliana]